MKIKNNWSGLFSGYDSHSHSLSLCCVQDQASVCTWYC